MLSLRGRPRAGLTAFPVLGWFFFKAILISFYGCRAPSLPVKVDVRPCPHLEDTLP